MKAYCLIRADPVYRRDAFLRGLQAAGFAATIEQPSLLPKARHEGNVLVIWNRYAQWHEMASAFEARGGVVLVAENAYLGLDRLDRRRYALARHAHNGRGEWFSDGTAQRWRKLGINIAPWRASGEHVLVCPNRSFGMPGGIMPVSWAEETAARLKRLTGRPVRVRAHPGNAPSRIPLADDLRNAWVVVIWSSSSGCEALVSGIPVICLAPWWICYDATDHALISVENPTLNDARRERALWALAWAQWDLQEIESGAAFRHLLDRTPAFAHSV